MSHEKIKEEYNLKERIDNLNKTIKVRKSVLDKMIKKLMDKEKSKEEG